MEPIEEIPHNGSGAAGCNAVVEEQELLFLWAFLNVEISSLRIWPNSLAGFHMGLTH
jgi:hypothetical protein